MMTMKPIPANMKNVIDTTLAIAAKRSAYEDRFVEGELYNVFGKLRDPERRELSRVLSYFHDALLVATR